MKEMKVEVFEHDYGKDKELLSLSGESKRADKVYQCAIDNNVYHSIGDRLQSLPRIINPIAKENFEQATAYLQFLAMVNFGKIKSVVNYENYDVTIDVYMPFFEFIGIEKEHLSFIANTAANVTFCKAEDGDLHLHVRYDYFDKIGDPDEIIQDEIAKNPEMFETLRTSIDEEREEALSDPRIYAMLKKGGESLGITAEEYYDYFNNAYNENPQAFFDILFKHLREQRNNDSSSV